MILDPLRFYEYLKLRAAENNRKSIAFIFSTRGKAKRKAYVNVSYKFNFLICFQPLRARTSWLVINGLAEGAIMQNAR